MSTGDESASLDAGRARFEEAIAAEGPLYPPAETRLREAGIAAAPALRENLDHPDPMARLLARVLLGWIEGQTRGIFAAVDYLEKLPEFLAETPFGPEAASAAAYLTRKFGARPAELLALHLVKGKHWKDWRVMAVIRYLDHHRLSSTTEALIRFAGETTRPHQRQAAAAALAASGDPDLHEKLASEQRRLEARGAALAAELTALLPPVDKPA